MTTAALENLENLSEMELKDLMRQAKDLLSRRNANGSPDPDTEVGPEADAALEATTEMTETTEPVEAAITEAGVTTTELMEAVTETSDFPELERLELETATPEATEPATILEVEAALEAAPETPAIEVKLDEIYTIKVVADEVIKNVDQLQQEVADLRAQVSGLIGREVLESEVERLVREEISRRFKI
ncbi:MAG TPA: hypothetical protein PKC76_02680 [Saprospiraceae bacterium]|nr:hypothetical protein [Saprospiraceae bacterium]HMP23006.1 hypothetical protein [Saprospiraceae bacterium]